MNKGFKVAIAAVATSLVGLGVWAQSSPEVAQLVAYGDGGAFKVLLANNVNLTAGLLSVTGRYPGVVQETLGFTAVAGNCYIQSDASASTATLPTAIGCSGSEVSIHNTGASTVTMASTASQTINGGSAGSTSIATTTSKLFISDGANWWTF
jgi:hypothetical protein